ncbi:MAG: excisionase family DNA-binding protein [Synergistaceae bacterium]|nr:excisionase family DNA-binding protein [Synergistaceae bacterium]
MDIQDLMSVEEAAKVLGYRNSSITMLCRQGKMEGAFRKGHQWLIPKATVENYERNPRGFAAMWQHKRRAEEAEFEAELAADGSDAEVSGNRESVEREILQCMRVLLRKIRVLEKIIAGDPAKCNAQEKV